jgi:hypothetical protein
MLPLSIGFCAAERQLYRGTRPNKRMQLAARGFWLSHAAGRRPLEPQVELRRLRGGPPGGVWSVHGGRQLMREPLGGAENSDARTGGKR